jgi:hypothetical protein
MESNCTRALEALGLQDIPKDWVDEVYKQNFFGTTGGLHSFAH